MSTPVVIQGDGSPVVIQQSTTPVVMVRDDGNPVVVVQAESTVVIAVAMQGPPGIQGPPGPSAGAGGATYTHTQNIALAVWTVAHNLGRYPSITVTDLLGRLIVPDVAYLDDNLVQISHGTPLAGFAYCN